MISLHNLFFLAMPLVNGLSPGGGEEATDAGVDLAFGGWIDLQDMGVPGLHPAVKDDWGGEANVEATNRGLCPVEVGGRFKPGKEGPEEALQVGCRFFGVIDYDHDWPLA